MTTHINPVHINPVIPAKAGTQSHECRGLLPWVPASAGMTEGGR